MEHPIVPQDNRVHVTEDELFVYEGGRHEPPAPRLEFGDWVSWTNKRGEREQGMFVGIGETDNLAIVRQDIFVYAHLRPNRLTVHDGGYTSGRERQTR